MNRLKYYVTVLLLLPLSAAAESPAPRPPAPRAAPAPAAPRPVPAKPAAPAIGAPMPLDFGDWRDWDLTSRDLQAKVDAQMAKADALAAKMQLKFDEQFTEQIRRVADEARLMASRNFDIQSNRDFMFADAQGPMTGRGGDEAQIYSSGISLVTQRQYDRAITMFDRVLAQKSTRADGALYWKAFSQTRLMKTDDALATLAELKKGYPQSRYTNDARVLETDVRKLAGQRIDPQTLDANDQIKVLAINGLAKTDPERSIPLLEGVLTGTNTPSTKKGALYVLALSDDARAHQILLRYAKGAGNPELQTEAIRNLASRTDLPNRSAELKEIYEATQDTAIRRSIIDAYRNAGDRQALMVIARRTTEPIELRRSAINGLSNLAPPQELWSLYQQEPDASLRIQMVNVLSSMGALDQIVDVAKTDKDLEVRRRALRALGEQRTDRTGNLLVELYSSDMDKASRQAIVNALADQNNATALVTVARKETDLDVKRDIVHRLSDMAPRNKIAADYLMEVLR